MKLTLTLDDEKYQEVCDAAAVTRTPPATHAATVLTTYGSVPRSERAILVRAPAREALEKTLGGTHLVSDGDLAARVAKLAALRVGEITIDFTPTQWQELTLRASKRGITVQEECQRIVKKMAGLFFQY